MKKGPHHNRQYRVMVIFSIKSNGTKFKMCCTMVQAKTSKDTPTERVMNDMRTQEEDPFRICIPRVVQQDHHLRDLIHVCKGQFALLEYDIQMCQLYERGTTDVTQQMGLNTYGTNVRPRMRLVETHHTTKMLLNTSKLMINSCFMRFFS